MGFLLVTLSVECPVWIGSMIVPAVGAFMRAEHQSLDWVHAHTYMTLRFLGPAMSGL